MKSEQASINTNTNTNTNTNEENLATYLNAFLQEQNINQIKFPRKKCCGTSRSLYCTECCKLLIDRERWPTSIQAGHLDLPFQLDIVLNDKRRSATGFHAHILLKASRGDHNHNDCTYDGTGCQTAQTEEERVRLIDIENNEPLPSYEGEDNTYVLFPSENSIPISSVASNIHRLVVLDCKWTKSSCQRLPEIDGLPKVHLDHPPSESFFWRWHNAGPGMCSTLEAIYFAAVEVAEVSCCFDFDNDSDIDSDNEKRKALIDLMWLFGIQRSATALGARREGKPVPFSKDGKNMQRDLRKTKGSEKHSRDIEIGKQLKAKATTH